MARARAGSGDLLQLNESLLLMAELRRHTVVEHPVERILSEPRITEPDRVTAGFGSELPEDRGLTPTLTVAPEMHIEAGPGEPNAKVRSHSLAGLGEPRMTPLMIQEIEDLDDAPHEIAGVARVID